jgi:hypothetical protein
LNFYKDYITEVEKVVQTKQFRMIKTIHRRIANGLTKSEGGLLIALNAYGALLKQNESTAHSAEEREELIAMLKRVRELKVKYKYPKSEFHIDKKQPDEK